MKLTLKQVQKKYKGKYIDVRKRPMWDTNEKGESLFEVHKAYTREHENTTRAEVIEKAMWYLSSNK